MIFEETLKAAGVKPAEETMPQKPPKKQKKYRDWSDWSKEQKPTTGGGQKKNKNITNWKIKRPVRVRPGY